MKSNFSCLLFIISLSIRIRMSWNIGDNRNLFLKLKRKLGLHHFALTTPKTSPKTLTLTVVEMHHLLDLEKTESKAEISYLNWTKYKGSKKVCVNIKTDTDKLNIAVFRYRNNVYLKHKEVDRKLTSYQSHSWQKEFIFRATLTNFTSGALYWLKQLFIIKLTLVKNWIIHCLKFVL